MVNNDWYDLVVFTASMEIYGAAVADKLDNNRGILRKRYYRQVSFVVIVDHHIFPY
jgi:CTD nuclear envelope phosphatase 1